MSDPAITSLEVRLDRAKEVADEDRQSRLEAISDDVARYRNNPHIDESDLDAIAGEVRRLLGEECSASD